MFHPHVDQRPMLRHEYPYCTYIISKIYDHGTFPPHNTPYNDPHNTPYNDPFINPHLNCRNFTFPLLSNNCIISFVFFPNNRKCR